MFFTRVFVDAPRSEKYVPRHIFFDVRKRHLQRAHPRERARLVCGGYILVRAFFRFGKRQNPAVDSRRLALEIVANLPLRVEHFQLVSPPRSPEQIGANARNKTRVAHALDNARIKRRKLDGGVQLARSSSPNEHGQVHRIFFEEFQHIRHFVERRRDKPAKPDQIGVLRGLQNPFGLYHNAQIDNVEPVARKHDAHDIFADVVDVALDGGNYDFRAAALRGGLHKRFECRHRALHDPRAFYDLRQKHFALAEKLADVLHRAHQILFDYTQRALLFPVEMQRQSLRLVVKPLDKRHAQFLLPRQRVEVRFRAVLVLGGVGLEGIRNRQKLFGGVRGSV